MVRNLRKEEIEKVRVTYVKGKYAYKNQYNVINKNPGNKILYTGPIKELQPVLENIVMLVRNPTRRIDTESRKALKRLEKNSMNPEHFSKLGITHIIIYICS